MLHIDKFQDLCIIAFILQKIGTHCICDQCRHSLLQDSISQNRLQHFILNLFINLMLTAGYGKDHLSTPFHSFGKCIVCGCITGVKCHYHIHRGYSLIIGNITMIKMQLLITISECQRIAFLYNIHFQIKANDIDIISL